jgi:hypothetical protein
MHTIAIIDDTIICTEPDLEVEPGHQRLLVSNTALGSALATLLTSSRITPAADGFLYVDHNSVVDEKLIALVDLAAHIRLTAPEMIQITLPLEYP